MQTLVEGSPASEDLIRNGAGSTLQAVEVTISVVICTYALNRLDDLKQAVTSALSQTRSPLEVLVVVDHNADLLRRACDSLPGARIVESRGQPGLSSARNTGVDASRGQVVAFLDDDATAAPDWLAVLSRAYLDPQVLGAGGAIQPKWISGRPAWFPEEFLWVVGCTYRGLPTAAADVRNVIGANMSFRREIVADLGFRHGLGRVGTTPLGGEETELCIRARAANPGGRILYMPSAVVKHIVPAQRAGWVYYASRCFSEGLSKASIVRLVGSRDGLGAERAHAMSTLPKAVLRELIGAAKGDPSALARAGAVMTGLAVAGVGYLAGTLGASLAVKPKGAANKDGDKAATAAGDRTAANLKPILPLDVELGGPLPALTTRATSGGEPYSRGRVLVRLHGRPLGLVDVAFATVALPASELAGRVWDELADVIADHLRADGLPPINRLTADGIVAPSPAPCQSALAEMLESTPLISVVICTRDRPETLAETLTGMFDLRYPRFEVIVVDNAPRSEATKDLITRLQVNHPELRYVREDRPGLSVGRNSGFEAARGEIVAVTDDDVLPDPNWLAELARGFKLGDGVACVTGPILARELETPAQLWIEQFGGFCKGFHERLFDLRANRPHDSLYPYAAGAFGSGANLALQRTIALQEGGFDVALGAGSPAGGGEELELFVRLIQRGHRIAYVPGALVRHAHHREYAALKNQVRGYGVGLSAYLTALMVNDPGLIARIAPRIPAALRYFLNPNSRKNASKGPSYPRELTRLELSGLLRGPALYLRGRRERAAWLRPSQAGGWPLGDSR